MVETETSSNLTKTLESIDNAIEVQKQNIERGEMLKRLKANPDFKELILDWFLNDSAKQLFELMISPDSSERLDEDAVRKTMSGITAFREAFGYGDYQGTIEAAALAAPFRIEQEQDFRKEVTAEYGEE